MVFWHWLALAAMFAAIEVAAPAMVCIWLAAGAVGVAAIDWLMPDLSWEHQALVFAGLAIAGVAIGRIALVGKGRAPSRPGLNRRAETYIGRLFTLDDAIVDGRGQLKVDDTVWRVVGPDLPAGTRVRVTGAENTILRVAAL